MFSQVGQFDFWKAQLHDIFYVCVTYNVTVKKYFVSRFISCLSIISLFRSQPESMLYLNSRKHKNSLWKLRPEKEFTRRKKCNLNGLREPFIFSFLMVKSFIHVRWKKWTEKQCFRSSHKHSRFVSPAIHSSFPWRPCTLGALQNLFASKTQTACVLKIILHIYDLRYKSRFWHESLSLAVLNISH